MIVVWWVLGCAEPAVPPDPPVTAPVVTTPPTPGTPPTLPPTGPPACPGLLRIDELVASNVSGAADEDGDHGDWIELTALTDALPAPVTLAIGDERWVISVPLPAGVPVQIWADGKDREDPPHTAASLASGGESVAVYAPDGCVLDVVAMPRMYADESYGRDAFGALGWFMEPTPGAPNTTEWRPGFAPTPALPPASLATLAVAVTVPAGADAVTTTRDGSVPTETSTPAGTVAVGQLTVVRARSFTAGLWPSRIATATYAPAPPWTGFRVISLAVDPPDLWDDESGIYVYGPNAEPYYPYFGANFWMPWEKDAHVEIWGADGALQVAQDAGIEIAGGYSRAFDQRNFELVARGGYGPDTFAGKLFDQEEIESFDRLYLRNGGDWCGTQLVDATVEALFRDASGARLESVDAQATEPALVYLNGEFWGLYELKERLDPSWPAAHRGVDEDEQDFVKLGWTHDANWALEAGDWAAYDALELAAEADLSDPVAWDAYAEQADILNFAMANVVQGWIGNSDWWGNNIRMWRERPDGRFRWMTYDFGHGWTDWRTDHLATTVNTSLPGMRVADALESEDFRTVFVNAHAEMLGTTLQGENAEAVLVALAAEVRPAMSAQRDRWCGGPDIAPFDAAVATAQDFARNRGAAMERDVGEWLAPGGPATLTLEAQGEGEFALTVVTVAPPFTATFYRDVPVTVTAVPAPGWRFVGWTDPALGAAATIVLPMAGASAVTAIFAP